MPRNLLCGHKSTLLYLCPTIPPSLRGLPPALASPPINRPSSANLNTHTATHRSLPYTRAPQWFVLHPLFMLLAFSLCAPLAVLFKKVGGKTNTQYVERETDTEGDERVRRREKQRDERETRERQRESERERRETRRERSKRTYLMRRALSPL